MCLAYHHPLTEASSSGQTILHWKLVTKRYHLPRENKALGLMVTNDQSCNSEYLYGQTCKLELKVVLEKILNIFHWCRDQDVCFNCQGSATFTSVFTQGQILSEPLGWLVTSHLFILESKWIFEAIVSNLKNFHQVVSEIFRTQW